MSSRDSLQLPRSVSRLKVGQTVLAIFVLGLTAYLEYYYEGDPYIIVPLVVVSSLMSLAGALAQTECTGGELTLK